MTPKLMNKFISSGGHLGENLISILDEEDNKVTIGIGYVIGSWRELSKWNQNDIWVEVKLDNLDKYQGRATRISNTQWIFNGKIIK